MRRQKADKVFMSAKIYTISPTNQIYEAVAVKDGKISNLGMNKDVNDWMGENTEIIDLRGRIVLPGFIDCHTHVPGLAYDILFNLNLYNALSSNETLSLIEDFVKENPDLEIYYGRGFNPAFFQGIESVKGPKKEHLDRICPDKPVILSDFGGNLYWMNSKAFETYKITKDTKSPEDGVIEIDDETKELWGVIREGARALVPPQHFSDDQKYQAHKLFQDVMNSYGYTTVFALRPPGTVEPRTPDLEVFARLEKQCELSLRIFGARDMDSMADIEQQLDGMKELRKRYHSDFIRFTTAKFFLDGVIESATAYLLEPYEEAAGKDKHYRGKFFWNSDKLTLAFQRCMEEGFQIHCHSIGDGATRIALDSLEKALSAVQPGDYRNSLTHLQLVSEEDIKRMSDLHVIANTQPFWHLKSPTMWWSLESPLLGERAEKEYPLQSFIREGVLVTASSDYPVTAEPNPLYAIQTGVTRNLNNSKAYQLPPLTDMDDPRYLLDENERADIMEMIKSYTINSAFALNQEKNLGSIEIGKFADFVILDQDPFTVDPLDLENIVIEQTVFNGETVYLYNRGASTIFHPRGGD